MKRSLVFSALLMLCLQCHQSVEKEVVQEEEPAAAAASMLHVILTQEQKAAIDMQMGVPTKKALQQHKTVFGEIVPNEQLYAHVVTPLSGRVVQVDKQKGDLVRQGERLALLESAELADAMTAHIAALHHRDVAEERLHRQERLYRQQLVAESSLIDAGNEAVEKRLNCLFTEQKLYLLGMTADQVKQLEKVPASRQASTWRLFELKAPLEGTILERDLVPGEWVAAQHPAFTVADLTTVWAKLSVPLSILEAVGMEKQLQVRDLVSEEHGSGKVIYISPLLTQENLTVDVLVELDNNANKWRLGSSLEADIAFKDKEGPLTLPKSAIQRIDGQEVAFVESPEGFMVRPVEVGICDEHCVEILEGLTSDDRCAMSNTFILKSQLVLSNEEEND